MTNKHNKNQHHGYAILFAVVMVSIISLLAIGLSGSSYKQLVLSLLAKDSQSAFFQADTASECALYSDNIRAIVYDPLSNQSWSCGMSGGNRNTFVVNPGVNSDSYELTSTSVGTSSLPCYEMSIIKDTSVSPIETTITARGYNSCNFGSPKTVQREIEVKY